MGFAWKRIRNFVFRFPSRPPSIPCFLRFRFTHHETYNAEQTLPEHGEFCHNHHAWQAYAATTTNLNLILTVLEVPALHFLKTKTKNSLLSLLSGIEPKQTFSINKYPQFAITPQLIILPLNLATFQTIR